MLLRTRGNSRDHIPCSLNLLKSHLLTSEGDINHDFKIKYFCELDATPGIPIQCSQNMLNVHLPTTESYIKSDCNVTTHDNNGQIYFIDSSVKTLCCVPPVEMALANFLVNRGRI